MEHKKRKIAPLFTTSVSFREIETTVFDPASVCLFMCVFVTAVPITKLFITAVPITKLFAWGEGERGGHVLRETTSQGLCGLVCPSCTSVRGGEGDCGKGEG
jgi:hypothetical protein